MTRHRINAFVDALLRNRRPRRFAPSASDIEAMRASIDLRSAEPGAGLPRPEFVSELHRRLGREQSELDELALAHEARPGPSRRNILAAGAAAAAAAVAGATIDHELTVGRGGGSAETETLVADQAVWRPAGTAADVASGGAVRFEKGGVTGFVSSANGRLRAVSGTCTHRGCLLALDEAGTKLACPCHRASFSLTGQVLGHQFASTPPRLPAIPVRQHNGMIEVFVPPDR